MTNIQITLPPSYHHRMVANGDGRIRVYGDVTYTIMLGIVKTQSEAMLMLDSYDGLVNRRQVIADLIDKDRAEQAPNVKELYDA